MCVDFPTLPLPSNIGRRRKRGREGEWKGKRKGKGGGPRAFSLFEPKIYILVRHIGKGEILFIPGNIQSKVVSWSGRILSKPPLNLLINIPFSKLENASAFLGDRAGSCSDALCVFWMFATALYSIKRGHVKTAGICDNNICY